MIALPGVGQHRPHRLDQAEADDRPGALARRRREAGGGEAALHRHADIVLAVDQGAVAVEDGEAVHGAHQLRDRQDCKAPGLRRRARARSVRLVLAELAGAAQRLDGQLVADDRLRAAFRSGPGLILARVQGGLGASRASWSALRASSRPVSSAVVEPAQRPFGLDRDIVPGRHLVGRPVPVGADIGVGAEAGDDRAGAVERRRRRGCRARRGSGSGRATRR